MRLRFESRLLVGSLRRTASRAVLAAAAVALGIAALVLLLALEAGARREMEEVADLLGRNFFTVKTSLLRSGARGRPVLLSPRLELQDVDRLRDELADLRALAPVLEGSLPVRFGRQSTTTAVRGVTEEYVELRGFRRGDGRLLEPADGSERRRVAVVGSFVAARLRAEGSLVGETLVIGGVPFVVVGQLAAKGVTGDGQNEDDQVLVPLQTAARRLWNVESLSRVLVQVNDAASLPEARRRAREVLRLSHRLADSESDDFEILGQARNDQIRSRGDALVRGLAQIFAALALALGGFGVLSVTFLNVRERTAEIGLRRAVGARRVEIARLFFAEASVLGLVGGVIGVLVGALAVVVVRAALGWRMSIDFGAVATSLSLAVALGWVFGVIPALYAARVTPVEALRDA